LLVIEQGAAAAVQGAQGSDLGGKDVQLTAQMAPQRWRHYPEGVEHAAAHSQESDVQRQAELDRRRERRRRTATHF
jgi:hypothetical protein